LIPLEQRIRPKLHAGPWPRDLLGGALVISLTGTLLVAWRVDPECYFNNVVGQMFSFLLLPAMGFALALRRGAVDLSVWATCALGGVVAGELIRAGLWPVAAFGATLLAGAGLGAIHGLLVGLLRLPSILVTFVSAAGIVAALTGLYDHRSVATGQGALEFWLEWSGLPPFVLRMLLVSAAWMTTMLVAAMIRRAVAPGHNLPHQGSAVLVCLSASGALAAFGGAVWLVEHGSAPIPVRMVGDLRVPAAAILAGAAFFAGAGRSMLVLLCLPATVLAATIWWLEVMHLNIAGYAVQSALLTVMGIVAHLAMAHAIRVARRGVATAVICVALTAGGMLMMAAAVGAERHATRRLVNAVSIAIWAIGGILLLAVRAAANKREHRSAHPARSRSRPS